MSAPTVWRAVPALHVKEIGVRVSGKETSHRLEACATNPWPLTPAF